MLLCVLCLRVFVCFVCDVSCGVVCLVVLCMFNVVACVVCALVCDGVWCVCVRLRVRSCVVFVRFVLLCLNMSVHVGLGCIV